ncbi:MAG: C40 family peptidase [Bacteroidetes bacterium]|nr:C40 family peptidase [Bacteroidota bacterium]
MLNRIHFIAFIFLLSFTSQYQNKVSFSASIKPLNAIKGLDRAALIDFAKQYLGTPYRRASIDPKKGFDCSGFVYFVFKKFHIDVPRSSKEYQSLGKALRPEEFKVGDVLVFYGYLDRANIGHVGIICEANGMKSRFIHASSGKPYGVTISELDSDGYRHRFYKCIDVIK